MGISLFGEYLIVSLHIFFANLALPPPSLEKTSSYSYADNTVLNENIKLNRLI